MSIVTEEISQKNIDVLARFFVMLWPESNYDEEHNNCKRIFRSQKETCLLLKKDREYIGFIYLSLRYDYVEGTLTSPTAYIEGIYIKPAYRKLGMGRRLINLGEEWGKTMGCKEYASDAELSNLLSISFHKKNGFREVNRIACFVKKIE